MAVAMQRVQKEFILRELIDRKTGVELHYGTRRCTGVLSDFSEYRLTIGVPASHGLREREIVRAYFSSGGHVMTFRTRVRRIEPEHLIVDNPDAIYRRLQREFERVQPPDDFSARLFFEGLPLGLDFPSSLRYVEPEAEINLSSRFDPSSIADLLKSFRDYATSMQAESKIVMFRSRRPASFAERIITRSGRILLLPMNDRIAHEVGVEHVLTEEDVHSLAMEQLHDEATLMADFASELERIASFERGSELYAPILYRRYVVGYLALVGGSAAKRFFEPEIVDYVREFCSVLAYSLNENGYFEGSVRPEPTQAEIVDISASGVLVALPADSPDMSTGASVEVSIDTPERTLRIGSRVVRSIQSAERRFFAIRFIEIETDDANYLMQVLYGGQYDGSIERRSNTEA